jgi:hypothetical protein
MARFRIAVTVECDTIEQAEEVANERLGYDEDYGFPYQFGFEEVTSL